MKKDTTPKKVKKTWTMQIPERADQDREGYVRAQRIKIAMRNKNR